jgi:hypothetical protein
MTQPGKRNGNVIKKKKKKKLGKVTHFITRVFMSRMDICPKRRM